MVGVVARLDIIRSMGRYLAQWTLTPLLRRKPRRSAGCSAGCSAPPAISAERGTGGGQRPAWCRAGPRPRACRRRTGHQPFLYPPEYPLPRAAAICFHFDLYRLSGPEDLLDLGFDEYLEAAGVTVVEWADRVPGLSAGGPAGCVWHAGEGDIAGCLYGLGKDGDGGFWPTCSGTGEKREE